QNADPPLATTRPEVVVILEGDAIDAVPGLGVGPLDGLDLRAFHVHLQQVDPAGAAGLYGVGQGDALHGLEAGVGGELVGEEGALGQDVGALEPGDAPTVRGRVGVDRHAIPQAVGVGVAAEAPLGFGPRLEG